MATVLFADTAFATGATPNFVQGNYAVPQTPQTNVTVPYTAAQTAGNLNVVIVGWNDTTAHVSSVTDTQQNVYQLAVGPTQLSGITSQSIFYAKNIAVAGAGVNASNYPELYNQRIRHLGFCGISPKISVSRDHAPPRI
jgi:hypothetical protein